MTNHSQQPQGNSVTDDQEWGNIQLPGYTDEQLHDPKFLKRLMLKQRAKDPLWIAAIQAAAKRRASDPDWIAALKRGRQEMLNDPVRLAKYLAGQAAAQQNPELKKLRRELGLQIWQKLGADAEFLNKRKARTRAVVGRSITTPYGVFDSIVAFAEATGLKPRDKLKLLPHLYYYTDTGPGEVKTEKVYYTPWGYHNGCQWSYNQALQANDASIGKCPKASVWFNKCAKKWPDRFYVLVETKREWALEGKPAQ